MPLIVVCGVARIAKAFAAEHVPDMAVAPVAQDLNAVAIGVAFFVDGVRYNSPKSWPAAAAVKLHLRGEERLAAACADVDPLLFQVVEATVRNAHGVPWLCGLAAQHLRRGQMPVLAAESVERAQNGFDFWVLRTM